MGHYLESTRAVLVVLATTSILYPSSYQSLLDATWSWLKTLTIYRASTFETFWTVFCYAAIEVPITVQFMKHPDWRFAVPGATKVPLRSKGLRRPSRRWKEALTYVAPLLTLDLLMIKKFADVSLQEMLRSGNYNVDMDMFNSSGHKASFLVPSMRNFTLSSPIQLERALPERAPTSRRLVSELIASIVLYDALFFAFHLALHKVPLVRDWHRSHHTHEEIHPQVTNQLHVFERLGLVLLANFSLNIIGSHVLTRTIFVPIFVWLLVEIHSGLDLPWAYDKILPAGWAGGARKHAKHHRTGDESYAPYFQWCDTIWTTLARPKQVSTSPR